MKTTNTSYAVFLTVIISLTILPLQAQTFSADVAPILYENCTSCHRQGGIAPFQLETFQDAFTNKASIKYAVSEGDMPPWPPDTSYNHYVGERILTQSEIATITNWVDNGAPHGDPSQTPPLPTFPDEGTLGTPDLQLRMPAFVSSAETVDDYICFVIPSGLTQDRVIRAVEVIPGNREIVHHALVFIEQDGNLTEGPIFNCGSPPAGKLLSGYTPGAGPTVFPATSPPMGFPMDAGSNLILAMHYPEGTAGLKDSTAVNFFFYPAGTTSFREVIAEPVISDWNFCIQPNQVQSLQGSIGGFNIPVDLTVLSVFPHMHLLGKSWEVYATTPTQDTLPFVKIDQWDFTWQGFYFFKHPQKLPAFSTIRAFAEYDNTVNNPNNPASPPQMACAGLNTTDEMFLVYAHFLPYQPGDELIDMEALTQITSIPKEPWPDLELSLSPNPFQESIEVALNLPKAAELELRLYSLHGQLVAREQLGRQAAGPLRLEWKVPAALPDGVYLYQLQVGEQVESGKLLRSSSR